MPEELPPAEPTSIAQFIPTLTVVGPNRERFAVPVNANANRAFAQITVARLRALYHKKLDEIEASPEPIDNKTLKNLAELGRTIEETAAMAYGMGKKTPEEKAISDFANLAMGAVRAAAAGAAEGSRSNSFEDRLKKIRSLGRRATGMGGAEVVAEVEPVKTAEALPAAQ